MRHRIQSILVGSLVLLLWGCGGSSSTTKADSVADATADTTDSVTPSTDSSDQTTPDDTSGGEDGSSDALAPTDALADTTGGQEDGGSDVLAPTDALADLTGGQDDGSDTAAPSDGSGDPDQLVGDQLDDLSQGDDAQTADLASNDDSQSGDVSGVSKIYVFPFVFQAAGGLTDRKTVNQSCVNSGPPNSCTTVIALVSFDGDAIKDFGTHYGVPMIGVPLVSTEDKPIANDLKTFLNPEFQTVSLLSAGVLSSGEKWWSFSTADGAYDTTDNCLNGQTSEADKFGSVGLAEATDGKRVAGGTASCTETHRMLCICF